MPIFMDFHKFDHVTIDEVKQAHVADKSVQNEYGVKYLQFWVNEKLGTVFCLMEGPSKEACAQVHREAHGNVACNMTEVKSGFYELFMGSNPKLDHGLVLKQNGRVDEGLRYLLMVDVIGLTKAKNINDFESLIDIGKQRKLVSNILERFRGNEIKNMWDDTILAVFDQDDFAIQSAIKIKEALLKNTGSSEFKVTLSIGEPLTEHHGFFEKALNRCQQLNLIANKNETVFDSRIEVPVELQDVVINNNVRCLDKKQGEFLKSFFKAIQSNMSNSNLNITLLVEQLGMSRPQIYRKITQLSGRSPVHFIRDIRLRKALALISKQKFSVSEIAYQVGYENPSYFSKCFSEKYGVAPSKIA
ncbi:nickel-binding protein [Hwangdonia sp.]|uniref:nickel-binding protein n=1 Tax=Hwangdonia sp. TaxID=1883432 RepID=UPI003AB588A8